MKIKSTSCKTPAAWFLVAISFSLMEHHSLRAGIDTWTGGAAPDGNWTAANNWGGAAPSANDQLDFTGGTQLQATNNFVAGTIFNNLLFDNAASAFTLSGNAMILTNGADGGLGTAAGGGVTNASSSAQTIAFPITLSAGRHVIANNGGGQLNLNGAVARKTGAVAAFDASGGINATGGLTTNGFNNILGAWAIVGNDWATLDANSNVVAYTAYTDVTGAPAIANAPSSNVRWTGDTGNATAANGTVINTLLPQIASARTLSIATGGTLKLGSQGGIYRSVLAGNTLTVAAASGTAFLTANGGGELTLLARPDTASGAITVTAIITNDSPANPVAVNIWGYVNLNAANTYSGGTYISQGRLSGNNAASCGTGPVYVYPGGQAFFGGNVTWTNDFFLSGIGSTENSGGVANAGLGAIRFSTGASILTGTITLLGDSRIDGGSGAANVIRGRITGPGKLELAAATGNNGSITITNGNNDWQGGLQLSAFIAGRQVYLKNGANNVIPDGVNAGDVTLNGASDIVRYDLNGFSDTINGLISSNSANNQVANFGTAPATLTVGNNNASGVYGGTFADNGTANNLSIVKIGTGTQTFNGANTRIGDTTVSGGKLVIGAGSSISGSPNITVNSNATLDVSAICPVTLGAGKTLTSSNGTMAVALQASTAAITTATLNANGTTNYIIITDIPDIAAYPAQFVAIKCATLNGALNFGLQGALPVSPGSPYVGFISNNVANNSVDFVVTGGPSSIKWVGYSSGAPNSSWDIGSTANWKTTAGAAATYADGVFVTFDDSASNSLATLTQDVAPAGITITNNVLAYTNNGPGRLTGTTGLTKRGSGKFILDNSGLNDFSGGVVIAAGTLQIGNNDTSGNLPASTTVADNGSLVFSRSDVVVDSSLISGAGAISQSGSGTLTLNGVNTFTGAVTVVQGTLITGNNAALGTTNGGTIVSNGATLDIGANAINLGQEPVTISGAGVGGAGALINSAALAGFVGPNVARVTLAGDTTVGGTGRFDLRSATTSNPLLSSLSTGGQPFKLTKVGTGTFGLIGCTVDPQLGDVEVQQGIFSLEAATTSLGNPASNLFIWPGATLQLFAITNQLDKVITMGGDGLTLSVSATSGSGNTVVGPMTLTNDCLFSANGATVSLALNSVIGGSGKLIKLGAGLLTLGGNSPAYAGGVQLNGGSVTLTGILGNNLGTTVGAGKFTLNGTLLGAGLTNVASSSVVGAGTNIGPMDIAGTLNPGDTNLVGTLTTGSLTLEGGATLNYDLASTTTPGGGTNDLIVVNGDLVVNGNSITINPLALLKTGPGNAYRLFNYTGNLIWNADLSVSGPGAYVFTVNTNTPGQVNLVASGGPPVWNGGSPTTSQWSDAANWSGVTINPGDTLYFDGITRLNNTNDTTADSNYGDIAFNTSAGAFVLSGNPINLAGNVINSSTNVETINLPLSYATSRTFDGGTGGVIIGGGVTNTANLLTLTLAGTGTLTNLLGCPDPNSMTNIISVTSNANWTLLDNAASLPITTPVQLDVLAGTFNFGSATSAPILTNTAVNNNSRIGVTPNAPATLNMVNGSFCIASRLNTGAAAGAVANINVSGGTLNPQALLQVSDSSANAYTAINVTGGALYVGDATGPNNFFLASRGTGVVSVASSGMIRCATLDVSRNAAGNTLGSVGVVNLNGGVLSATRVGTATSAAQAGGTPTATFNFNGGTLLAGASSATFYQGNAASPAIPIQSIVKAGGAIIDTTNFNISVLEPLQHDSALGSVPDGGLTKYGAGTLTLTAASTFTGPTVVGNGTLFISGSLGKTPVAVLTNAALAGTGSVGSNVTVNAGGAISPALPGTLGTLTVASNIVLQGTAVMDLNKSTLTNDVLKAGGSITFGGALAVTNLAGTLTASDTFKLFSAASYTGAFAAITPAVPAPGLAWNTNTLATDGILRFVATVNVNPTNITVVLSGNTLTLSWPPDYTGWHLQSQTNTVGSGLGTNWVTIPNTDLSNSYTNTVDTANGTIFYRMVYP